MEQEPAPGRLLVAMPSLADPNFDGSVVLLLGHGSDGAIGLVLNDPSDSVVDDALPGWGQAAVEPPVVFVGGPVQPEAAIVLAGPSVAGEELPRPLAADDVERGPDELDAQGIRVFAGYAGWGPGQLEAELSAGAWVVVDAVADDALSPAPEELWRRVLRRQRGSVSWLANLPRDPSVN